MTGSGGGEYILSPNFEKIKGGVNKFLENPRDGAPSAKKTLHLVSVIPH